MSVKLNVYRMPLIDSVKFSSSKEDRKEFRKKDGKDSQSPQGITCFSDLESSNLDSEGSCDEERELLSIYDYCSC